MKARERKHTCIPRQNNTNGVQTVKLVLEYECYFQIFFGTCISSDLENPNCTMDVIREAFLRPAQGTSSASLRANDICK